LNGISVVFSVFGSIFTNQSALPGFVRTYFRGVGAFRPGNAYFNAIHAGFNGSTFKGLIKRGETMKSFNKSVYSIQFTGWFLLATSLSMPGAVQAGATFKIDETKWVSIGAGLRTSFSSVENSSGVNKNKWGADFNLDNIRLYMNGQIHEYIKFEFNTDCGDCSDGGNMIILDAIGKFEESPNLL
ncbi:MAG: hypothetical protein ACRERS_04895, partial [Methylococcales bacterium]